MILANYIYNKSKTTGQKIDQAIKEDSKSDQINRK